MDQIGPGTVIDGLEIDAGAGRGGFGVAYRATDLASGHQVGVKAMSPGRMARQLLAREAALLATVDQKDEQADITLTWHWDDILIASG